MLRLSKAIRISAACGLFLAFSVTQSFASSEDEEKFEKKQPTLDERHQEFVYGVPDVPTNDWTLSSGGRIYDNWMNALEKKAPEGNHPAWPASNTKIQGESTWRCKACHGWDYKGVDGNYASGSWQTGIKGVMQRQGTKPSSMAAILRNATHQYTPDMISDAQALRLGLFLSRGLHDTDAYIDPDSGKTRGIASRGARIYQNVCAACHGFQGTKLDWGSDEEHAYVGTEANANPWEVLHKIRNGHPGHEMISMRPFPMDVAVDILTYIRTLPEK